MAMEIDHIFICAKPGAPEAELLKQFGLQEGSANHHPGQGTANRRFFFHNSFIELIYATNNDELLSETTQPTQLFDRLNGGTDTISPFGLCLRPDAQQNDKRAPFPSWHYRPAYLPPHLTVEIGEAPPVEPMWFFLGFSTRPDATAEDKRQPLNHPLDVKEITRLHMGVSDMDNLSAAGHMIAELESIELFAAQQPLMEIEFDNQRQNQERDFRPALPLILRW